MYIIFSEKDDKQTNEIMDRLHFYDKEVKRYNDDFNETQLKELSGFLRSLKITINSELSIKGNKVAIYHRRPIPTLIDLLLDRELVEKDIVYPNFKKDSRYFRLLKNNYLVHQNRFYEIVLNNPNYSICKLNHRVNKLDVLAKASEVGMDVPNTLVSGDREEIIKFYQECNENIITKSLYAIIPSYNGNNEGFTLKSYTEPVEDIEMLPEQCFPTFFQQNIEKAYEIRVFFLDGKCYSAAILSQANNNSHVDYRREDRKNPSRIVPYNLNSKTKSQIIELMKAVGLNTGSLDFIIGQDGKTYFLEVNPVGQYGFINSACNFKISDDIAKKMIQFHERE